MKVAILLIATGEKYHQYIQPFIESAKQYLKFDHDVILWTDSYKDYGTKFHFMKESFGYPDETLMRYHTFLERMSILFEYDFLLYSDVDMLWASDVQLDEVVSTGVTATLHPGYVGRVGTPERRPQSMAYVPLGTNNKYFCGGFNGGTVQAFTSMAIYIKSCVEIDARKGITPVWHDESYLNRYLLDYPPARILTPSFCWPEGCDGKYTSWTESYPAKLVALTKGPR